MDASEIDYARLDDRQFEELCFDLLRRVGFVELEWRQGGGDQGRDIAGYFNAVNPLFGTLRERWFVQCKRYTTGVPPTPLSEAVTWADSERPQHLLFILSSYPTVPARGWLDKTQQQKAYSIHTLEGKPLSVLLVQFPELVERYFPSEPRRLLHQTIEAWANHGISPTYQHIALFIDELRPDELTQRELVFVWVASRLAFETGGYEWDDELPPLSLEPFSDALAESPNCTEPITAQLGPFSIRSTGMSWSLDGLLTATALLEDRESQLRGVYFDTRLSDGRQLEVLFTAAPKFLVRTLSPDEENIEAVAHRLFDAMWKQDDQDSIAPETKLKDE